MNHLTYMPASTGGWIVLASAPRLLALATAPNARLTADLFDALTAESGFRGALDLLTSGGISATPDFVLVEVLAARTRIVVRGDIHVFFSDISGDHDITGADVSTWAERSVPGFTKLRVDVPAAVPADSATHLPLSSGVVYASSIGLAVVARESAPASAVAIVASALVDGPISEATVTEAPHTAAEGADRGQKPSDTPAAGYDYLFGDTVFHSIAEAAVRSDDDHAEDGTARDVAAETQRSDSTSAAGDHDGHTVVTSHIAALRAGRSENVKAAAPGEAPAFVLEFANGARESFDQAVILGRAPSASKVSGGRIPRLITVGGADQDISRSHAQFVVEGDTVVVTDLHSRNGTLITLPGKGTRKLRAGEPTTVILGTLVDFGGGITLMIGRA